MKLSERLGKFSDETNDWKVHCVLQAKTLVSNFKAERIEAQHQWFQKMAAQGMAVNKYSRGAWCPLTLFSRCQNGSLQIYWQLVNRDKRRKQSNSLVYQHLAKGSKEGYDLRSLLKHAHDFERDLVAMYEKEAQMQRARWQSLIKLEDQIAQLDRDNCKESNYLRSRSFESRDEIPYR